MSDPQSPDMKSSVPDATTKASIDQGTPNIDQSAVNSSSVNSSSIQSDHPTNKTTETGSAASVHRQEDRKPIPAFIMGILGGLVTTAILALVALIFNPLSDINERLGYVETNVSAAATRRALETNDKRLVNVENRIDNLRTDLDSINRNPITPTPDLSSIRNHLAEIDQILLNLQQDTNKSKTLPSLTIAQDTARLTLALIITDHLEQGLPIKSELQIIEPLINDQILLEKLKPWNEGNPSQMLLMQEFSRAIPNILKSIPVPVDEPVQQMLLRTFKQWVHWRRLDQNEPSDPESLLQLAGSRLQKGMNEDALKLLHAAPQSMSQSTQALTKLISQRIDALNAGNLLLNSAMNQLAQTTNNKGGSQ
jgi:hypothetical protein